MYTFFNNGIAKIDRGFEDLKRAFKTAVNDDSRITMAHRTVTPGGLAMATLITAKQVGKLIEVFQNTPSEQVQNLFESGLLADVRDGNVSQVNRDEFRRMLGLEPLATPMLNLAGFFKTREGLWVSREFTERILTPALEMAETTRASVGKPFNLQRNMVDDEIRNELGDNHIFEDTYAFLFHLGAVLEFQWGGKDGELLTDGYASIFYVRGLGREVFAVSIHRIIDYRRWDIHAFRLDDTLWNVGYRAFPCTSPRTPSSTKKEEDRNLPRRGEIRTFLP